MPSRTIRYMIYSEEKIDGLDAGSISNSVNGSVDLASSNTLSPGKSREMLHDGAWYLLLIVCGINLFYRWL